MCMLHISFSSQPFTSVGIKANAQVFHLLLELINSATGIQKLQMQKLEDYLQWKRLNIISQTTYWTSGSWRPAVFHPKELWQHLSFMLANM